MLALDSQIIVKDKNKTQILPINGFFTSYRKTKLKKGQFIHSIRIPFLKQNIFKAYKISKRIDDDISSVFMAINANIKNNTFKSIKIVCGGMAEIPKIAKLTQKYLLNRKFNAENINEAKNIIAKEFNPIDDMRASKEYRKKISQNLLERFLHEQNQINTAIY